jgi:hypothetical protein
MSKLLAEPNPKTRQNSYPLVRFLEAQYFSKTVNLYFCFTVFLCFFKSLFATVMLVQQYS